MWRQDTTLAAEPRAKLPRRGLRRALEAIVVQHLTVARIAEGLSVTWNTANDAVLAEGKGPRRTLHTGADLLTDKQKDRLLTLFAADEHVQVEATWTI